MDLTDAMVPLTPIAVRHEAFCPYNGYVGPEASKNRSFMKETYLTMLDGWICHLYNDELDNFTDGRIKHSSESEMWKEVEMLTRHLKA